MNESNKIAIQCKNLYKTFVEADIKVDVLKGVDLSVTQGELVAIVGVSGSGKSTLLHLLGGLDKPTSGEVFVDRHEMTKMGERTKGQIRNQYLGFIYQFHHLLPEFNALENVCIPLLIRGLKPKQAIAKAKDIVDRVGLANRIKHRVGELSGGERQRIAIARALVTEPKCVLADEPTGNLDHKTAEHIFELMLRLNKDLKTSFVVVTHNESLAQKMDRMLVLQNGKLSHS